MESECGHKYRLNVRAVIYRDEKILVVQHRDKTTGESVGYWSTPGGGIEETEALLDGMRRELLEELAVKAKIGRLLFCMQWFNKKKNTEMMEFFFLIENPEDFLSVDLSKTTHGAQEIAKIEFLDPKKVEILPRVLSELDLQDLCENLREVRMVSYLEQP